MNKKQMIIHGSRKWLPLLVALLFCDVLAADAAEYLEEGRVRYANGEFPAAVIQFKNALQEDPDNKEARLLLGESYLRTGQSLSAIKELEKAAELGVAIDRWQYPLAKAYLASGQTKRLLAEIEIDSSSPAIERRKIQAIRGHAYYLEGDIAKAEELFKGVLGEQPDQVDALVGMARIEAARDNIDAAKSAIQKVLSLDETNADALFISAELGQLAGDTTSALSGYNKVIEIRSYDQTARLARAFINVKAGKHDIAREDIDFVLSASPNHPVANHLSAVAQLADGKEDAAIESLQKTLAVAPKYMPSHLIMGMLGYKRGSLNQAQYHLEIYNNAIPGNSQVLKTLAAVFIKKGEAQQAVNLLEAAPENIEHDAQWLAILGNAHLKAGDADRAIDYMKQAVELAPEVANNHTQLAIIHLAQGNAAGAESELESAIELDAGLPQAELLLILTRIGTGQYDQALEAIAALKAKKPDDPVPFNLAGAAYAGKHHYKAARAEYEKALKLAPDFITTKLQLASLSVKEGDFNAAAKWFREVIAIDDTFEAAYLGLYQLAKQQGDAAKALQSLESAWEKNPGGARAPILLLDEYFKQGEIESALEIAQSLHAKYPDNQAVMRALGSAELALGKHNDAVITFTRLLELNPDDLFTNNRLALAYIGGKEWGEAREVLEEIVKKYPTDAQSKLQLGGVYRQLKRFDEALAISEELKEHETLSALAYELKGSSYAGQFNWPEASKAFKISYDKKPTSRRLIQFVTAEKANGGGQKAISAMNKWLESNSDDDQVRQILAQLHHKLGELQAAASHYEILLQDHPDNVSILNNVAWIYQEQGNAKALEYAERAYHAAPERAEVADTYGWILVQNGKSEKGLNFLQEATIKAPHIGEIRYHVAVALSNLGRQDEAIRELKTALRRENILEDRDAATKLLKRLEDSRR